MWIMSFLSWIFAWPDGHLWSNIFGMAVGTLLATVFRKYISTWFHRVVNKKMEDHLDAQDDHLAKQDQHLQEQDIHLHRHEQHLMEIKTSLNHISGGMHGK
jgi:hypothetical protein